MSTMEDDIEAMAKAWKSGDGTKMYDELLVKPIKKHPEVKPMFEKVFDERNAAMAEKIDVFMKEKEMHFVVVAAGHLIGDKGVVKLLQNKGYKVEQVRK